MGGWSRRFMAGLATVLGTVALGLAALAVWHLYLGLQPDPPEPRTVTVTSRLERPAHYRLQVHGMGGSDSPIGVKMTLDGVTVRPGDSFEIRPGQSEARVTPVIPSGTPRRQYAGELVLRPDGDGQYLTERRFDFFVHVRSFWDRFGMAMAAGIGMLVSLVGSNFLACRVRRRPVGHLHFEDWPHEVEESGRPATGLRRVGRQSGLFWNCGEVRIGRAKWRNDLVLPHSSVPARAATVRRYDDPQSEATRIQIRAEPGRTVHLYEREGMTDRQARLSGGQWTDLTDGDEIRIGDYRLIYRR